MKTADLAKLTVLLDHTFSDASLIDQALTHPSAGSPARPDNQRMEFLGDRVLGLVVAEMLMEAFPNAPEGELAPRFNALVRRETLAEIAEQIGIGQYLRLGRSENISGGRRKAAILADAMEAVIAALYMDGGFDIAKGFILAHWSAQVRQVRSAPVDPKTALQEWAQARGMAPPDYALLERTGPDHAPEFLISAKLSTGEMAEGTARSKKLAEQEAASALLERVQHDD